MNYNYARKTVADRDVETKEKKNKKKNKKKKKGKK